jgi:hypothetical protein
MLTLELLFPKKPGPTAAAAAAAAAADPWRVPQHRGADACGWRIRNVHA